MKNYIENVTIDNFLSFNAEQSVDFSKDHISCFVGHNGSGKTNLLLAISELVEFYLNPSAQKRSIRPSFDQQKRPTSISMEFVADDEKFSYTIEVLAENDTVLKEELRSQDHKLVLDMELRSDIGSFNDIEKERLATYSVANLGIFHLLCSEQVKIQDIAISNAIEKVGLFFKNIIIVDNDAICKFDYEEELYTNSKTKSKVLEFMNGLDYGIEDIQIEKITNRLERLESSYDGQSNEENENYAELFNALTKFLKSIPESQQSVLDTRYSVKYLKRPFLQNPISISMESRGVRRLIKLLTWIFANEEKIILVDELEQGFHEALVMKLIHEVNNSVNQFIFTSHLLELMTRNCLNKNQLFSVVKENGQSVVYALSQIENIRDDRHSLKNLYRAGRIPGYPFISE